MLFLTSFQAVPETANGQTTIDPSNPYAYSANAGWIDLSNDASGVGVGDTVLYGYAHGANFGWVHFGDGTPENGDAYSNTSNIDYGVNRDAAGDLSGYAYGANIGWIDFSWASSNDPNQPRFDPGTGEFFGYCYSANLGWILLGTEQLRTARVMAPDTDRDGAEDQWELTYFPTLDVVGVGTDYDGDGQPDTAEAIAGTDPTDNTSFLHIVSYSLNEGLTEVTVVFTSVPGLIYRIEYGSFLSDDWIDSGFGLFSPDAGDTTTRTFSFTANSRQFFRVTTVKPLLP